MVLQRQALKRKILYKNARTKVDLVYRMSSLFRSLSGIISHIAVRKMTKQLSTMQPKMIPCTGSFIRVSDLPYKHFLHQHLTEQGDYTRLLLSEFHKHWFFDVNANPLYPPILQVQDPDIVERRRTRRRGLAQSSTQRGLTTAEVEDQRLDQQRRLQTRDIPRSRIQQQYTLDRQQQSQLTPPRQTPTVQKTPSPAKPKPKRRRPTKTVQQARAAVQRANNNTKNTAESHTEAESGAEYGRDKRVKKVRFQIKEMAGEVSEEPIHASPSHGA